MRSIIILLFLSELRRKKYYVKFFFVEKFGDKKDFKVLKVLFIFILNKLFISDVILMICIICFGEKK